MCIILSSFRNSVGVQPRKNSPYRGSFAPRGGRLGWGGGVALRVRPPTLSLPLKGGGSLTKLARACSDNTHIKPRWTRFTFLAPENACGIAIHFCEKRFEVPGSRRVLVRPPPPVPVVPVERPEAGRGTEPKLGNGGLHPCRRIVKARPGLEQRDGVAADRVAEPNLMLDVREQAAVVETGEQSLNEALFELGQHSWILFPSTRNACCKSHRAAASLHRVRLSGPAGSIAVRAPNIMKRACGASQNRR